MCVCVCVLVCTLITSALSLSPSQRAYTLIVEAWDRDNGTHSNGKTPPSDTGQTPGLRQFVSKSQNSILFSFLLLTLFYTRFPCNITTSSSISSQTQTPENVWKIESGTFWDIWEIVHVQQQEHVGTSRRGAEISVVVHSSSTRRRPSSPEDLEPPRVSEWTSSSSSCTAPLLHPEILVFFQFHVRHLLKISTTLTLCLLQLVPVSLARVPLGS